MGYIWQKRCQEGLDIVKTLPKFDGTQNSYVLPRQATRTMSNADGSSRYYKAVLIIRNKIRSSG